MNVWAVDGFRWGTVRDYIERYRCVLAAFVMLYVLALTGCTGAVSVPCASGDCLNLMPGTTTWIVNTALYSNSSFVAALQGVDDPTKIVAAAKIANGFGVAGIDATLKESFPVCGTWMNCKDFVSLIKDAVGSGKWKVVPKEEIRDFILEPGTKATLATWIVRAANVGETMAAGVVFYDDELFMDILEQSGVAVDVPQY